MLQITPALPDTRNAVTEFIDCFGRMWEAQSPWSFFRQRIGEDWEEEKARRAAEQDMVDTEGRSGSFYDLGRGI